MKNITPRQLATLTGAALCAAVYFNQWFFAKILYSEQQNILRLVIALVTGLMAYGVTRYIIKHYLVRKVRHIYEMIHRPSSTVDPPTQISPDKPLFQQVEKEVSLFIKSQNKEMSALRDLERYRQDFVGNVAHELKTPIFNIQGYVHTLLDGALSDPNVNLLYLRKTADNTDRLIKIIEDLDSIYKLESEQLSLEWEDIELIGFTEVTIHEMELMAAEKKISLHLKTETEHEIWVKADPDYLRQVYINLIENSIKYGNERGHTTISLHDLGEQVLVEVADDGPGIEAKHLRHIFDRFYRVDRARSRQAGGSGLGLSIVKHIVEAHGQQIKVRSSPGKGTVFSFTLASKTD